MIYTEITGMNEKMLEMTMISLDDGVVMPELSFYLDATTREACEDMQSRMRNVYFWQILFIRTAIRQFRFMR